MFQERPDLQLLPTSPMQCTERSIRARVRFYNGQPSNRRMRRSGAVTRQEVEASSAFNLPSATFARAHTTSSSARAALSSARTTSSSARAALSLGNRFLAGRAPFALARNHRSTRRPKIPFGCLARGVIAHDFDPLVQTSQVALCGEAATRIQRDQCIAMMEPGAFAALAVHELMIGGNAKLRIVVLLPNTTVS